MYFHLAFRGLITPRSLVDVSQAILGSMARFPRACLWLHKQPRDLENQELQNVSAEQRFRNCSATKGLGRLSSRTKSATILTCHSQRLSLLMPFALAYSVRFRRVTICGASNTVVGKGPKFSIKILLTIIGCRSTNMAEAFLSSDWNSSCCYKRRITKFD